MGDKYLFCCTLILASALLIHAATQNALVYDGFEIIALDYPAFVSEFHYDWVTDNFYVYGQGTFRQINHNNKTGFQAIDNATLVPYDQEFVDVRMFTDNTGKFWAVGPTFNTRDDPQSAKGYFFPMTVIGPGVSINYQGDYSGYTFYAVSLDTRNTSNVLAYFCGWGPGKDISIDFVVVRARFSLTQFAGITWDNQKDVIYLHSNNYRPYTTTDKPRLIHDYRNNEIFVISPSFLKIYRVGAPADGVSPLQLYESVDINGYGQLTGTSFRWAIDRVFLTFMPTEHSNATLLEFDLTSLKVTNKLYFPVNYTNPKALTGRNNTLYVGFEGGQGLISVLADGKSFQISGYARTPGWLRNVYSAWDEGTDHVYFATYEQDSKVFRTSKKNFCKNPCPDHGYCQNQVCYCAFPYKLSKDKKSCDLHLTTEKKVSDRGAAVAFGILFALALVIGSIGWFLVYQAKQKGYQRVL